MNKWYIIYVSKRERKELTKEEKMKRIYQKDLKAKLNELFYANDAVAGCYFWHNDNGNASVREQREKSLSVPPFYFLFGGKRYEIEFSVSQSRKHTYVSRNYYRDGNKVNLTAIKNVYKQLEAN